VFVTMRKAAFVFSFVCIALLAVPSDTAFRTGSTTRHRRSLHSLTKSTKPFHTFFEQAISFQRGGLGSTFGDLTEENQDANTSTELAIDELTCTAEGSVMRLAARSFRDDGASCPSSTNYTTRKDFLPLLTLLHTGVSGDYNHYRTQALKSTRDRAVSILTTDVMQSLRSEEKYRLVGDGDLGENILVGGLGFRFFEVGRRYLLSAGASVVGRDQQDKGVLIEITEPMVPCANLCKLPYINSSDLRPADRIERCQSFLEWLGRAEGLRGWYAKVISEGNVRLGDKVTAIG